MPHMRPLFDRTHGLQNHQPGARIEARVRSVAYLGEGRNRRCNREANRSARGIQGVRRRRRPRGADSRRGRRSGAGTAGSSKVGSRRRRVDPSLSTGERDRACRPRGSSRREEAENDPRRLAWPHGLVRNPLAAMRRPGSAVRPDHPRCRSSHVRRRLGRLRSHTASRGAGDRSRRQGQRTLLADGRRRSVRRADPRHRGRPAGGPVADGDRLRPVRIRRRRST